MLEDIEEVRKAASELVDITINIKELTEKAKELKEELLAYTDEKGINDTSWATQNGYVEIETKTKTTLCDIPAIASIDMSICDPDTAKIALKPKMLLTKEGKKMLKEDDERITNLVIQEEKKTLKVVPRV